MRRTAYTPGSLAGEDRASLERDGVLYLEGVTGEAELLALAEQLGEITAPGVWKSGSLHDGRIYSVEVRNRGRGEVDDHGNVIVSSTSQPFSLHTDGYSHREPPRYVLLLRTDHSSDTTLSYISDSRDVLGALDTEVVATLATPVFPSALGPLRLVEPDVGSGGRLRFNGNEVDHWAGEPDLNPPMDDRAREAVADLSRSLSDHRQEFTIGSADCLVVDNWRACHGRSAIAADSGRVLKRVWVA
jgi:alpha-ketoglutarate-dependent taurine dioxygenase